MFRRASSEDDLYEFVWYVVCFQRLTVVSNYSTFWVDCDPVILPARDAIDFIEETTSSTSSTTARAVTTAYEPSTTTSTTRHRIDSTTRRNLLHNEEVAGELLTCHLLLVKWVKSVALYYLYTIHSMYSYTYTMVYYFDKSLYKFFSWIPFLLRMDCNVFSYMLSFKLKHFDTS